MKKVGVEAPADAGVKDDDRTDRAARKAERVATKQRVAAERLLRRQQESGALHAAERREQEATAARAFENYRQVRDWLRRVSGAGGSRAPELSAAERQMVSGLAHLWDARPEVVSSLRRWTEPMTGVRAADYEHPTRDLALHLKYQVGFLRRHAGAHLFVQESPLLGGFGVEWHRQRYNEDTVRFFKAVVALHDGGVLADCLEGRRRKLVWEIGGGWGGFAFQFKTLCPNTTYLITGLPECLLVSATYLMTAFPDARCRFDDPSGRAALWSDWEQADFVFAAATAVGEMAPPELHAVLDVMALRCMSDLRVSEHVRRAFDLGARYFFSQLPGPCFPEERPDVWRAIGERYWLHQIPPRLDAAAFAVDDFDSAPRIDDYAQMVGWRRMLV